MNPPRRPDDTDPPPPPEVGGNPAPPPARDPLLDDPLFAEVVPPRAAEPVVAEVVARPAPIPGGRPVPPAAPVRPAFPPGRRDPPPAVRPAPESETAPRSKVLTACGVMGCFGVVLLAAVGFLIYAAITVLGDLGGRVGRADRPPPPAVADRPGPVEKTRLAANTARIELPAAYDAVGRAAGGRYLLLRVPARKELVVFDANAGEVIRTLPLGDARALVAGGAAKLFVYRPSTAEVERYDLTTWEKEATAKKPAGMGLVEAVAVGPAADGPVFLVARTLEGAADVRALDADALTLVSALRVQGWTKGEVVHARASHDGAVLAVSGDPALVFRYAPATGLKALALWEGANAPRLATPSPDGEYVYTPRGVFSTDGKVVLRPTAREFFPFPPAHGGGLYLSLREVNTGRLGTELRVHPAGSKEVRTTLDAVKIPPLWANDDGDIPADQRVHVWPAAGLVAVLPPDTNLTLELTKVDLPAKP